MAQVWPRQDTFDAGGTHFGSRLTQYLGCRPDTAFAYGTLCDFDGDGAPYPHGLGGTADAACGFLWRAYQPEDVEVEVQAYLRENAPLDIPSSPLLSCIGVMARVTGGTLTADATPGIHYSGVSGYGFLLQCDPLTTNVTWSLVRWNSGTRTVLASVTYPLGAVPTDFEKPVGLKLRAVQSAGNVALTATISNIFYNGAVVTNFTLFPFVDSSGSRITGTGRCGFLLGQDRQIDFALNFPIRLREKVTAFETRNPATSATLVRDEFVRVNKAASYQDTSDFGTTGRSLQSGFYHDIQGTGPSAGKILRSTSPADGIEFEAPGLGTPNTTTWCALSQRPPDDTRKQNPKVVGRWKSAGSQGSEHRRELGVIGRASMASPNSTATNLSGYVGKIILTASGWIARIDRHLAGSAVVRTLGELTISALSLDTDYTLELAVRDQPGTGLGGPAEMELALDGTRINLVAATTIPGVFNSSSGVIVDGTADRITEGPAEGIWVRYNDTERIVHVTTWDQGTIVPSEVPWVDLESYPVLGEGSASGLLNDYCRVIYPFLPRFVYATQTVLSDAAYRYTNARLSKGYATYEELATEPLTQAQYEALLGFWHLKAGGQAFNFQDPRDGITRKVRFIPGSFEPVSLFKGVWAARFGLEELA